MIYARYLVSMLLTANRSFNCTNLIKRNLLPFFDLTTFDYDSVEVASLRGL